MSTETPFGAIADPTRRAILDLLLERGPLPAGEIAAQFPQISRPAVAKHVRILKEAGLVEDQPRGRERYYHLNPEPIRQMYQEWFSRYEQFWTDKLQALKRFVEGADDPHD